jgi:hypothetical protein
MKLFSVAKKELFQIHCEIFELIPHHTYTTVTIMFFNFILKKCQNGRIILEKGVPKEHNKYGTFISLVPSSWHLATIWPHIQIRLINPKFLKFIHYFDGF